MGGIQQLCIDWQKKGDLCLLSCGNEAGQEGLMKWPEDLRRLITGFKTNQSGSGGLAEEMAGEV